MPNPENLKPHNLKNKSKKERREIATKGAAATNIVIKAKKTIAEILDGLDSRFLKQKIDSIKSNTKLSDAKKTEYINILKGLN